MWGEPGFDSFPPRRTSSGRKPESDGGSHEGILEEEHPKEPLGAALSRFSEQPRGQWRGWGDSPRDGSGRRWGREGVQTIQLFTGHHG